MIERKLIKIDGKTGLRQIALAFCDDGQAHAFNLIDDKLADLPSCGTDVKDVRIAETSDYTCIECVENAINWAIGFDLCPPKNDLS